jgi:hypothetical protein
VWSKKSEKQLSWKVLNKSISDTIQVAYIKEKGKGRYNMHLNGRCVIDFNEMTMTCLNKPDCVYKLAKNESQPNNSQDNFELPNTISSLTYMIQPPPENWNWIDGPIETPQIVELNETTGLYDAVSKRFYQTMPNRNTIIKDITIPLDRFEIVQIFSIQNPLLYDNYYNEKKKLIKQRLISQMKEGISINSKDIIIQEELLFHGSRSIHPVKIYNGPDGFDNRLSRDGNLIGKGIYFAVNAFYSHRYSHKFEIEGHKPGESQFMAMFLASVLVGSVSYVDIDLKEKGDAISLPPFKEMDCRSFSCEDRFDSVQYDHQGSKNCVVYDSARVYPRYMIVYRKI